MNPRERFQRVEAIFRSAMGLLPDERERFVSAECADETTMRDEVLAMLRVDAQAAGVLDRPALGESFRLADHPARPRSATTMPVRIGRYRIVGVLGEGGMGVVYEAEQAYPSRRVALKVISGNALSPRSIRRFRQEAEVLGRLQHPGIGQIFEAGVDDWGAGQQPFLAMELVVGKPLLEFAAGHGLGVPERLALLARICDAVHHAHQKGIVHRDLKPGNILVVYDGDDLSAATGSATGSSHDMLAAQPKVLDFGVARVLDIETDGTTVQTRVGQLVGTLAYMSPEQAAGDVAAIDTRSDVYALGVIGYELLSGRLPHDLAGKRLSESLQIVREVPAPRLGSHDRGLRGDIETIIGKALAREPGDRYASSAEMAADLRRVIRLEPIQARRARPVEQIWRFARRNRMIVGSAVVALLALVVATIVSLRMAGIADARAAEARRQSYRSSLAAAAAALRFHEVVDARQALEDAPPELRGWEWAHLWSQLDQSEMVFETGRRVATLVAISPDGATVVAAQRGGGLWARRLDDAESRREGRVSGNYLERWATAVGFAPDGSSVEVGTRRGRVLVDPDTLGVIERRDPSSNVVAVSPEAQLVARREDRGSTVQVDDTSDGSPLLTIEHADDATSVAFSPDGRLVAIVDPNDAGLLVRSLDDGRTLLERRDVRLATDMCFSPDGGTLAVAGFEGSIRLIQLAAGGVEDRILRGHATTATAIAFSPDGAVLASASSDHTVRLWNVSTDELLAVMQGNEATPTGIAFAPDGGFVATACSDGVIRLWPTARHGDPFILRTPQTVYGLAFAPPGPNVGGQRLWAACLGGEDPLRCWDIGSGTQVAALGDGYLSTVAVDAGGSRVAVGRSQSGPTVVMDEQGGTLAELSGHWWRTDWVGFTTDGAGLLSAGNSGWVRNQDLDSGVVLAKRRFAANADGLGMRAALSPDGSTLAVTAGKAILLLDPQTLTEHGRLDGHEGPIHALSFSPDGATLASGSADRSVRLWDVRHRHAIATLEGSTDPIYALAFSPDGRRLASGGVDRIVRIWDPVHFDELVRLNGHSSFVYCLAWSPDGSCLASGGGDDTVRLWQTHSAREAMTHPRRVERGVEARGERPGLVEPPRATTRGLR